LLSLAVSSANAALKDENLLAPIPQGFKAGYTAANRKKIPPNSVPAARQ